MRSFRAVETAVRSALARSPLTGDPKTELLFGAKRLALGIRSFRNLPNRGAVYRLVPSALFVGLRASLQSDEIDSLSAPVRSEMGGAGGKKEPFRSQSEEALGAARDSACN